MKELYKYEPSFEIKSINEFKLKEIFNYFLQKETNLFNKLKITDNLLNEYKKIIILKIKKKFLMN